MRSSTRSNLTGRLVQKLRASAAADSCCDTQTRDTSGALTARSESAKSPPRLAALTPCGDTGKIADLGDCCRADTPIRSLSDVSRSRQTIGQHGRFVRQAADADSSRDQPGVGPWRISQYPLHAPGAPRLTSTELTGPVAEGGTGSSKQDLNPPQGAYTRRGPRSRAEYPNHVEPHGRYYARPIRHSVDRKVALNRNYCRSVTILTLGLKAISFSSRLTYSTSRCAPAVQATQAGLRTLIQTGPRRDVPSTLPIFSSASAHRRTLVQYRPSYSRDKQVKPSSFSFPGGRHQLAPPGWRLGPVFFDRHLGAVAARSRAEKLLIRLQAR